MFNKLNEMEVFNEDGVSKTNVVIQVESFSELEGVLDKISNLKEKYPYTNFHIEVSMH